jgi:hypothetical protein
MFATSEDARGVKRIIECACVFDHLRGTISVAAAAKGIIGLIIKRDIEHGTEIQIEAQHAQEPTSDVTMPPDKREIAAITKLVRVRRFVADELQPGNAATFLVDRDDWLDRAKFAKVVDELPKLRWSLNVATEQDKGAGLNAPEGSSRFGIEFGAGHAGHQELAEGRHEALKEMSIAA